MMLLLALLALILPPNDGSVELDLSSDQISLHDHLTLSLTAAAPPGYIWDQESLHKGLDLRSGAGGTFSIVEERLELLEDGRQRATFILEAWRAAESSLTFLPARLISPDGPPLEWYGAPRKVSIAPPVGPSDQLQAASLLPVGSRPPLTISETNRDRFQTDPELNREAQKRTSQLFSDRRWVRRALLMIALLIVALLIARRLRWRSSSRSESIDPRREAAAALAQLAGKQLPEHGAFDAFYVELTGIVRRFIEGCYQVRAPERTTEEFLAEVTQHTTFDLTTKGMLRDFLSLADLVKFARHAPSLDQCADAFASAESFIGRSG